MCMQHTCLIVWVGFLLNLFTYVVVTTWFPQRMTYMYDRSPGFGIITMMLNFGVLYPHLCTFMTFSSQSPANVKRLSGYDVEPLRIDIMAAIEHSKLVQ